jgi:hypothetical protein
MWSLLIFIDSLMEAKAKPTPPTQPNQEQTMRSSIPQPICDISRNENFHPSIIQF